MYAREKIQPKLHALDQNKLADLFADLRRESQATGSYPITVRHLESMIRMAEASAKMALREYVRADDIDLAIEVAVGSFVSAQKMSIKKTLQRVGGIHNIILSVLNLVLGLPEVPDTKQRPRRVVGILAWWSGEGQGEAPPAATPRATRIGYG
jgi:DNA replicative helicase MCM subunit Mcm2 (Cdc46/Mcm family)